MLKLGMYAILQEYVDWKGYEKFKRKKAQKQRNRHRRRVSKCKLNFVNTVTW